MTNHPNRAIRMHHFAINADAASGDWDMGTIEYLGEVVRSDFLAMADTEAVHYDQHDGDALDGRFWDVAGVKPTTKTVAITVTWVN